MKKRVLLGMSGGVDSSVAGYLLRQQGYDVVGVTMKVWPQDCISRAEDKCCGPQAVADAREVARSLGLKVADKADSQEICFVPGNDYKAFLRSHLDQEEFHPGGIYDLEGNFLGEHEGIEMFTIGQRKGLPGGSAQPRYVVDLDPETNRVLVGSAEDLVSDDFEIDRVNWIIRRDADGPFDVTVKIRYSHPGTPATV